MNFIQKIVSRIFNISSVCYAFNQAMIKKRERNSDFIYVFVDIHNTIIHPNYEVEKEKPIITFYPHALEVMKTLTDREDVILVAYTCSYKKDINYYLKHFKINGVRFKYVNRNPLVKNNEYANFQEKPYMSVLLDSKAGFNPMEDWKKIGKFLKKNPVK